MTTTHRHRQATRFGDRVEAIGHTLVAVLVITTTAALSAAVGIAGLLIVLDLIGAR